MGQTNIGYGIVNLESFREYAERGKELTFKFDMRGEPICLGDIVKITTHNGGERVEMFKVVHSLTEGQYALQKLGSKYDISKSLDAFMYWRGSIFKEDIEVLAKGVAND